MNKNREFEQGKHYYLDNGKVVFTELYHLDRGICCGKGCLHCVFNPKHQKGNKQLNNKFISS